MHDRIPPSPQARALRNHRDALLAEAARRGLENVRVFGSVARGEADEDSDIDLLVSIIPNAKVGGIAMIGFQSRAEKMLGRPVDLVFDDELDTGLLSRKALIKDAISV